MRSRAVKMGSLIPMKARTCREDERVSCGGGSSSPPPGETRARNRCPARLREARGSQKVRSSSKSPGKIHEQS